MTLLRLTVNLWPEERQALRALALLERRDPRDQAAILIRRELLRCGLLENQAPQMNTEDAETEAMVCD